jgi:hypothetical protein
MDPGSASSPPRTVRHDDSRRREKNQRFLVLLWRERGHRPCYPKKLVKGENFGLSLRSWGSNGSRPRRTPALDKPARSKHERINSASRPFPTGLMLAQEQPITKNPCHPAGLGASVCIGPCHCCACVPRWLALSCSKASTQNDVSMVFDSRWPAAIDEMGQKLKFDREPVAATRLAVTGCDAEPALGHLHGDCTQKIAFADVHPAMAQDRVGGCEMEIEVRQHEMV